MPDPLFPAPGKRVGRPNIPSGDAFTRRIQGALDSGWLSNGGPLAKELEQKIARLCGANHALVVCNATVGIELLLKATAVGPEILMPSFTFAATIQAARWIGLEPVLVDVDPTTHLATRAAIEAKLTERTGAVLGVHLWGEICDLGDFAVPTLYDAAHAVAWKGGLAQFGQASVLSFHATKFLNAFEGGCIVTNDAALADKLRKMSNFGNGLPALAHGTNAKMSEASAAMALASLEGVAPIIERNRQNHRAYTETFAGAPHARILPLDLERNNCQYVVLELAASSPLSIDAVVEALAADNLFVRPYFRPVGHQILALEDAAFPVSARLAKSVAILPTGQQLLPAEATRIAGRIRELVG